MSRVLRRRLAVTTILAVVPFLGYGRQAYAACVASPAPPTFLCSGTETTQQTVNADNADVSTAPGFSVNTGDATGVFIIGNGHLQFTDENSPPTVINAATTGLRVISLNVVALPPGGVTITTNGTITGGAIGINAENISGGDLSITANGEVTGTSDVGIRARNYGVNLAITTGAESDITGRYGIFARNYGSGDFDLTVDGDVTGTNTNGIYARNDGGDLTIKTGAQSVITAGTTGINAHNDGSGDLDITVEGQVAANGRDGITAENDGTDLTITTSASSVIDAEQDGIDARNYGSGDLEITTNGQVTGATRDGIFARNGGYDDGELEVFGGDLVIETGAQSAITGYSNGVQARNYGNGDLTITADGTVTGEDSDGIYALNVNGEFYNEDAQETYIGGGHDLTITTGAQSVITGDDDGIDARNYGDGDLAITANGRVTGTFGDGIFAENEDDGGDLTIETGAGSVVRAYSDGIDAQNFGGGDLEITANGQIFTEDDNGIEADNYGNDLEIIAGAGSVISAGHDGISASQFGDGNLEIEANGTVVGRGDDGIYAESYGANFSVTTGAQSVVRGVDDGIDARHYGDGDFEITADGDVTGTEDNGIEAFNEGSGDTAIAVGAAGLVQGANAGIFADSEDNQDISITNDGTVRNLSGESQQLAILSEGGSTDIENNGDLIGTVETDSYNDELDNSGLWNMAGGTSDFGDGDDEVTNSGTLRAGDDPATAEHTLIDNLETFDNDGGLVTLVDGDAGDFLLLRSSAPGSLEYEAANGRLAVDGDLGPTGIADLLRISGNTQGTTLVHVNVVNVTGANTEGIPVVIAEDGGTTAEGDFDLDGPLNAGFFTWDLRLDDGGGSFHELFTTGVGVGAFEFAAGITGAQDIWHQTTGLLLQRQADLRVLLDGQGVTPVADFAEPVAPAPVARVTPGLWFQGVGAWVEREDEEDGFTLDRRQTIWGGMAGFDFGTQDVGSAWLFGVFGGYLVSDLKFDETNTEWGYEGPTAGAYATYLDHAFYADLTVKADFLDIEIDPEDLAPGSDDAGTDALNLGGRIDTGYKLGETFFIEPQASLAVVHTEIDDVDIFGGTVEFDDATSVRGRLGLRVGVDHTGAGDVVYSSDVTASVWEEFSGENEVTVVDTGLPSFGVSDDPGQTYGDVALGFSVAAPEGWSGFIRGNYLFGEDYEAVTGNAGLRYAF